MKFLELYGKSMRSLASVVKHHPLKYGKGWSPVGSHIRNWSQMSGCWHCWFKNLLVHLVSYVLQNFTHIMRTAETQMWNRTSIVGHPDTWRKSVPIKLDIFEKKFLLSWHCSPELMIPQYIIFFSHFSLCLEKDYMKNKLIRAQSQLQFPSGCAVFSLDAIWEKAYMDSQCKLVCQTQWSAQKMLFRAFILHLTVLDIPV